MRFDSTEFFGDCGKSSFRVVKKGPEKASWSELEAGREVKTGDSCAVGAVEHERERSWERRWSVPLLLHMGDIRAGFYAEGICLVKSGKLMMHEK